MAPASLLLLWRSSSDAAAPAMRDERERAVRRIGSTVEGVSSMVSLGASVSIAPDQEPEAYGATLIRVHDAAGREVRSEPRGRELELLDILIFIELDDGERVSNAPEEIRLLARLDGTMDELRERVEQMVYDDGDRWPRWRNLMAALNARGVRADDPAIAALPLTLEFTGEVLALYES